MLRTAVPLFASCLLLVNLAFRFAWLDRLPGVNGDEAWYGVQVQRSLDGKPWSRQTPSGLPINPMLFLTETALLKFLEPSFWVLRLPIALWACAGLASTYVLHHWVSRARTEAMLVTLLTACLPVHLAYSRFCWDASFGLVTLPLVLYPLLKLLQRESLLPAALLFVLGSLLSLWVHVTNAVFVAAALAVLIWGFRREICRGIRIKPITSLGLAVALAVGLVLGARKAKRPVRLLVESARIGLWRLPQHLEALTDVLLGPRIYGYPAGVPHSPWTRWAYPLLLVAGPASVVVLWRRGSEQDRSLIRLAGVTGASLLVLGQALSLRHPSYERYILYLVPLAALCGVRAIRAWTGIRWPGSSRPSVYATMAISLGLLLQFWLNYFKPLRDQTYSAVLHRTFRTGPEEPKASAAAALRERVDGQTRALVLAEDWWVQHPVDYLLAGRALVLGGLEPERVPDGDAAQVFVVGHAGSDYIAHAQASAAGRLVEQLQFDGPSGSPILILLVLARTR